MPSTYLELQCVLADGTDELLLECLDGLTVLGSSLAPRADGRLQATIYFDPSHATDLDELVRRLHVFGGEVHEPVERPDEDWIEGYRHHALPFEVGSSWWIDPHADRPTPAPDGRIRLVLEPRQAFGSGTHESTRLALMALEERPPVDQTVLDVGTGSGVLALAAHRLGADCVVALDIDPMCVWVARETAQQQEWTVRGVHFLAGTLDALNGTSRFGVVLCNMVSDRMTPLLPALARHLEADGRALLSGLLAVERQAVVERLAVHRLRTVDEAVLGDWISLEVRHG
jgi:ribosomal protein L11 methyltransferase